MGPKKLSIKSFHSDPITVSFTRRPSLKKTPSCPAGFTWQNKTFEIQSCIHEWKEFSRRGRMARNMQPQHAEAASQHGSWGVGRFFFTVETTSGRYFRIYYDRAPKDAFDREGQWILMAELSQQED
jgi:hypothetical protein